jgi:cobalt/nickel transport system permease protein
LSSLRLPSITGSSSHPTGIAVGTYLFGPGVMPALALITLVFQALLLAHGGLTTLGANLFSLGIVGPWVTWWVLRAARQMRLSSSAGIFSATVAGQLGTYVTTAAQLAFAYPSPVGGVVASLEKFVGIFFLTQVPLAIVEGMLTVALLRALAGSHVVALETPAAVRELPRALWQRSMTAIGLLTAIVTTVFVLNQYVDRPGSDDLAQEAVQTLRPGFVPITTPMWQPGPITEQLLFAAQGVVGVAILWWAFRRLRHSHPRPHGQVHRHRLHLHPHLSDIAFTNRWRRRNPWEKVLFGGGFLLVVLIVPPVPWALAAAAVVSLAATAGARIPVRSWLTVLSVPVALAMLTAIGILIQIDSSASQFGVSIDLNGIPMATGLLLRSIAAISCLAFIGWTTPLMELMPVFGRIGVPVVLIDLALMIYHFLFVTASTLGEMRRAQSWRLGKADARSRLRALSMLASGLFVRCLDRVRRLQDGIESRGYEGHLWVLAPERRVSPVFVTGTLALQAGLLALGLLWRAA